MRDPSGTAVHTHNLKVWILELGRFTESWSWRKGEMDCCFAYTGLATLRSMSMASPAQRLSSAAGRLIQHWQWPGRLTLHHSRRRDRLHLTRGADGARHWIGDPLRRFRFWRPLGARRSWRRCTRSTGALSCWPLNPLAQGSRSAGWVIRTRATDLAIMHR